MSMQILYFFWLCLTLDLDFHLKLRIIILDFTEDKHVLKFHKAFSSIRIYFQRREKGTKLDSFTFERDFRERW